MTMTAELIAPWSVTLGGDSYHIRDANSNDVGAAWCQGIADVMAASPDLLAALLAQIAAEEAHELYLKGMSATVGITPSASLMSGLTNLREQAALAKADALTLRDAALRKAVSEGMSMDRIDRAVAAGKAALARALGLHAEAQRVVRGS